MQTIITKGWALAAVLLLTLSFSCSALKPGPREVILTEVARSNRQWTGVAVSMEGRVFVNYPRWSNDVPVSVAELTPSGVPRPFPDTEWNTWSESLSPEHHFVCVQSVYVDDQNYLWILDPANPKFDGVVTGGPKLLKVDLRTNRIAQKILFNESIAPRDSYLNDLRVDTRRGYAYITDSGTGALVVVNLSNGQMRRLLANHPSTKSEHIILVISGRQWRRPDGSIQRVHADGIALDREGEYLYYQALTGQNLYRIATRWLQDTGISSQQLGEKVEFVGRTGAADGILFGPEGSLYLTSIVDSSIKRLTPDRRVEVVTQDYRLAWPDSFAVDSRGFMYVTTSQIHRMPYAPEPYRLFRFKP